MPDRWNFTQSPGNAALGGFAAGVDQGLAPYIKEILQRRSSALTAQREQQMKLFNDALVDLRSGAKTPQEVEGITGVPAAKLSAFVPSTQQALGALNEKLGPETTTEEANIRMHALGPFRSQPDIPNTTDELTQSSPFANPGSISTENETPVTEKIANLLNAKRAQKESDIQPTIQGEATETTPGFGTGGETATGEGTPPIGQDVQTFKTLSRFIPRTGRVEEVNRTPAGPSAAQKGLATGIEALLAAPGQSAADVQKFNDLTGPTAARTSATKQAELSTETNPANVRLESQRAAALAEAQKRGSDIGAAAGIGEGVERQYLRANSMNRPYLAFPTGTPAEVQTVVTNRLQKQVPGIRRVNEQQAQALTNNDVARANYDNLVDRIKDKLAKTWKGNIVTAPANKLAAAIQSDPELAAALANFPQEVQGLRSIAGPFGRITYQEIQKSGNVFYQPGDTLKTLLIKRDRFGQALENGDNGIFSYQYQAPTQ